MTQPQQNQSYNDALVAAAALYAAAQTTPSLDALSATIRSASVATKRIQQSTVERIVRLWRGVNPYDDREVANFAASAAKVINPAQQSVARITAATQTKALQTAGVRVTVSPKIPDNIRSAGPSGALERRPRATVNYDRGPQQTVTQRSSDNVRIFARAAETYRYSRSQGQDHAEATTAAEGRIDTLVDGNLQATRSLVEFQAMQQVQTVDLDRPIIGYRRIIHPELSAGGVCGMCVVAADRIYKTSELKAIHHRCACTVLPVFEDYDPGHQLNGEDLGKLYKAAGGSTRKQLKRTRYTVEEHSELGPMLTPVKGAPVPYFPVPA